MLVLRLVWGKPLADLSTKLRPNSIPLCPAPNKAGHGRRQLGLPLQRSYQYPKSPQYPNNKLRMNAFTNFISSQIHPAPPYCYPPKHKKKHKHIWILILFSSPILRSPHGDLPGLELPRQHYLGFQPGLPLNQHLPILLNERITKKYQNKGKSTNWSKCPQPEQFTVDLGAHPPYHQPPEGFKVTTLFPDFEIDSYSLILRCPTATWVSSPGRTPGRTGTPAWRAAPPSTSPPSPPTWTSSTPTATSRKWISFYSRGEN